MPNFTIINSSLPAVPSSYTLVAGTPTCTSPKNHVCYVIAADNGLGQPAITTSILVDMITGLNVKADQPSVKLKA